MSHKFVPASTANSYDRVPYPSHSFAASHPDRLATMAALFGLHPQAVERCRVLEIGCASGGNIIPMAESLPECEFVGFDYSPVQIADAQNKVEMLGLQNIRLEVKNCLDIGNELEEFDYIICHGVFSWVPRNVQDKILEICRQNLAPHGVAYVSYNTRPGWNMRATIRDMMLYHIAGLDDPKARVSQARAVLDFLVQSVPAENNAYGMMLKAEMTQIQKQADAYLLHEHMEDVNDPVYFHEFMERAQQAGLQYVGEADLGVMWSGNLKPETAQALQGAANDIVKMEQYMDFLRNRMFRRTLLCHKELKIDRNLTTRSLEGRYLAADLKLVEADPDLCSNIAVQFRNPRQQIVSTTSPITKAAFLCLGKSWPASIRFEDLLSQAAMSLGAASSPTDEQHRILGNDLLRCIASDQIEISVSPSRFTIEIGERPVARRLARLQAVSGSNVTNLRHELTGLNEVDRALIKLLDGEHDRGRIVEAMTKKAIDGELTVSVEQQPVRDAERLEGYLSRAVDLSLERFREWRCW